MKKLFLLLGLLFACEKEEKPVSISQRDEPLKVVVQKIEESQLFETLAFGGQLEPSSKLNLYAKAHGTVTEVYVKLGDNIKKNQKLMKVSPKDINFRAYFVIAPKAGVLLERFVHAGEHVEQDEKLVSLAELDQFETTLEASLKDLSYLELGSQLEVVLAEYTKLEKRTRGLVKEISPVANSLTGTFSVKVAVECLKGDPCYESLKAGTYAKLLLKKNERTGVKLPLRCLVNENKKVVLLDSEGKIKRANVTLGKNYGDDAEILEGVSPGDLLVVSSSKYPKDGDIAIITD